MCDQTIDSSHNHAVNLEPLDSRSAFPGHREAIEFSVNVFSTYAISARPSRQTQSEIRTILTKQHAATPQKTTVKRVHCSPLQQACTPADPSCPRPAVCRPMAMQQRGLYLATAILPQCRWNAPPQLPRESALRTCRQAAAAVGPLALAAGHPLSPPPLPRLLPLSYC